MSKVTDIYPAEGITLREVGLRDGLQLVRAWPDTEAKLAWIAAEYAAGVRNFEIGSFLPASRMPQFADIRDLIAAVQHHPMGHAAALALNERGAADAAATPVEEIVCVLSATEEHSQANMRRSRKAAIALVRHVADLARAAPHRPIVNAGIAMAFGCSIAGEVAQDEVIRLAEACLEAGADLVGIADTVGYAGPRQVGALAARMTKLCGAVPYAVHLHDTRGLGIANAAAALDAGARILDGALGGLGGCPFAPGASGNVVFEDLVFLAETKGWRTNIDIPALAKVRAIAEAAMPGEPFAGGISRAGLPPWMGSRAA